jgi:hypothetical protein
VEPLTTRLKDGAVMCLQWAEVLIMTLCMAWTETTHVPILVLYIASVVSLVMLECRAAFYDTVGWWPSLAIAGLAALLLASMYMFLQRTDQMERVAEKYEIEDGRLGLGDLQRLEDAENEQVETPHLGPLQMLVENLRQPDSVASLAALLRKSRELGLAFQTRVLLKLFQALPPGSTGSATPPEFNLKAAKRAREKIRLEYNKDFRQLKDTLRGSIICKNLADVALVWKQLKQLEVDGVLTVLQVKNRYRGPPMPGGYRDINVNVLFEGMICEVQMHTAGHYALKKEVHPSYALCRSVGLVGDIQELDSGGRLATKIEHRQAPGFMMKMNIFVLRFGFALFLCIMAGLYSSGQALEYVEEEGWVRHWKAISLATPCWVLSSMFFLGIWDANRTVSLLSQSFGFAGGVVWYLATPATFRYYFPTLMYASVNYVPFLAVLLRRQFMHRGPASKLHRVALLYSLYFGVDGDYFAWKSAILQCLTVGLQAHVKLALVGTVVSGPGSAAVYWILLATLAGNAVLPPLLLSSSTPWIRREGAMSFDVLCDLFYTVFVAFFFAAHQWDISPFTPLDTLAYASVVSPCLRIMSNARTLEKGSWAVGTGNDPSKLPRKAAIGLGLVSFAMLALVFLMKRDIYPWNPDACRPCDCSGNMVLERCAVDGQRLVLSRRGITRIKAGAFNDARNLEFLQLSLNTIETLPAGAFVGASNLKSLMLNYNELFFFEAGAFHNLTQLTQLYLDNNALSSLGDLGGAMSDLPSGELLVLIGNPLSCEDVDTHLKQTTGDWECWD